MSGKRLLLAFCAGALVLFGPRYAVDAVYLRRALPEEIGVTVMIGSGSSFNPLLFFVPLRPESCGGAAFRLSAATVAALEKDGLEHLRTALVGRGYRGDRREHVYTYEPWRATPAPGAWTSEGMWAGLRCMEALWLSEADISRAAGEPGSFYTTMPEGELLVIPSMRLAVLTYYG